MTLNKRDELRQSARTTTWQATEVCKLEGHKLDEFMEYCRDVNPSFVGYFPEVWSVNLIERRGLLPPEFISQEFGNQKDAQNYFDLFKEERVIHANDPTEVSARYTQEILDAGLWREYWAEQKSNQNPASDDLANSILMSAEIVCEDLTSHPDVLKFSGHDRINELRKKFPATWHYIVELEFAMLNLSKDSPAYIACAIRYCKYFSRDLILAGYLIRDLEILIFRAENKHRSAAIRNERSTIGSRNAADKKLLGRYQTLIQKMEEMAANPKNYRLTAAAKVASVAGKAAQLLEKQKNPNWAGGGAKSVSNYIANIRHDPKLRDLRTRLEQVEATIKSIKNHSVKGKPT